MTFKILPAAPADVPQIVTIGHDAFLSEPLVSQLMANVPPDMKRAYDMRYYAREFEMASLNGLRLSKVVDETGKILGWAKWQYPYNLTAEQKARKEELDREEERENLYPEGTNKELFQDFFGALKEKKEKWMDESRDFYLQILAVAPTNQRKGLGAMLISEGLADADRENARTYIEGSLHGLQLYLRHGWKQVDELVTDMGKYGGHGLTSVKCLLREPGGG
ncbi:hypothetical protein MMC28_010303 [Mycoblastus sanguinarius]|nr:hypothetical protein [Mycoblastus sanguinarius]